MLYSRSQQILYNRRQPILYSRSQQILYNRRQPILYSRSTAVSRVNLRIGALGEFSF